MLLKSIATVAVLISMSAAVNAGTLCGKNVGKVYSGGNKHRTHIGVSNKGVVTYQQGTGCLKLGTLKVGKLTTVTSSGVTIKLWKRGKRFKISWNNPRRGKDSMYLK